MRDPHHPLIAELERRIHELEQHADDAFGKFGALDWWLCVLIGLVLPLLLVVRFWP